MAVRIHTMIIPCLLTIAGMVVQDTVQQLNCEIITDILANSFTQNLQKQYLNDIVIA